MKLTTPINRICMQFVDKTSHLTTKQYNFDIKCQCSSESYDRHGFLGIKLGAVRIFYLLWEVLKQERVLWWRLAGPFSIPHVF